MIKTLSVQCELPEPMKAEEAKKCLEIICLKLNELSEAKVTISPLSILDEKLTANILLTSSLEDIPARLIEKISRLAVMPTLMEMASETEQKLEKVTQNWKQESINNKENIKRIEGLTKECDNLRAGSAKMIKEIVELRQKDEAVQEKLLLFESVKTENLQLAQEIANVNEKYRSAQEELLLMEDKCEQQAKEINKANQKIKLLKHYQELNPDKAEAQLEIANLKKQLLEVTNEKSEIYKESLNLAKENTGLAKENTGLAKEKASFEKLRGDFYVLAYNLLNIVTPLLVRSEIEKVIQVYKAEHQRIAQEKKVTCNFVDYKNRIVPEDEAKGSVVLNHMDKCNVLNSAFYSNAYSLKNAFKEMSYKIHCYYKTKIPVTDPIEKENLNKLFAFVKAHKLLSNDELKNFEVVLVKDIEDLKEALK